MNLGSEEQVWVFLDALGLLVVISDIYIREKLMDDEKKQKQSDRIKAMLNDAMQNGYDISDWTVDDIMTDLIAFADLQEEDTEDAVRPIIIEWKAARITRD